MALHDALVWPAPKPLEGVKSKKKAIFKADSAEVRTDGGKVSRLTGLSLCLESRVAAVGEAGRAAVALLLQKDSICKAAWRQPGVVVAHLGPHLAKPDADAKGHLAAAMAALQEKPHIVVLDEALPAGGAAWAAAFAALLRSDGLAGFRGAAVVACTEETFAVRRACTEHWVETASQRLRQEEVPGRSLEVLEDVLGAGAAQLRGGGHAGGGSAARRRGGGDESEALLEEARQLSEFCFEEDLAQCAKKEGWTVAFLVEAGSDGSRGLRGYLCYRTVAAPRSELLIERLAVPPKLRGRGLARQLMRWVLEHAARMPPEQCSFLTCSAFDKVVKFYSNIGFVPVPCPTPKDDDDSDPQTWMSLRNVSLLEPAVEALAVA